MRNYTISIVIPTFNSSKTLESLLLSIRKQEYSQKYLEIILADGGSKDNTKQIAKKYKTKLIDVYPRSKQYAEFNRAYGAHRAKGEILAFFDHDNILPHKHLLEKMVEPFSEIKNLVGVETLYYHYSRQFTALDRYFALFGVNDPLPFYLRKADRQSYLFDDYALVGKAQDRGKYYLVEFEKDTIPTLGSNGFLIRKSILMKHAQVDMNHFLHIDVNVDLIRKGYNTYAFIKDSITHLSNHKDFGAYLGRRKSYMEKYHFIDKKYRRYSVYEQKDILKLIGFILISLTILKPFIDSIRGYIKIRDAAWFLHPVMCFSTVVIYGYTFITTKK